jgi:hypothetical protein
MFCPAEADNRLIGRRVPAADALPDTPASRFPAGGGLISARPAVTGKRHQQHFSVFFPSPFL